MIRLQPQQRDPYFAAFCVIDILDIRVEIVKACPRPRAGSLSKTRVRQAPQGDLPTVVAPPYTSRLDSPDLATGSSILMTVNMGEI